MSQFCHIRMYNIYNSRIRQTGHSCYRTLSDGLSDIFQLRLSRDAADYLYVLQYLVKTDRTSKYGYTPVEKRMAQVFWICRPKRVPPMERSGIEAVENNGFKTQNPAELWAEFGAERFRMASADKAGNPPREKPAAAQRDLEMGWVSRSPGSSGRPQTAVPSHGLRDGHTGTL